MPKKLAEKTAKSPGKTTDLPIDSALSEDAKELNRTVNSQTNKLTELEQRLKRLEKRFKSNERLATSLAECLATQIVAVDAVGEVVRRNLTDDATTAQTLEAAIKYYDKHKFRRFLSGFFSILLWIASIAAAACVGAFIYWFASSN